MKSAPAALPERAQAARRSLLAAVTAGRSPHGLLLCGGDLASLVATAREVAVAHLGRPVDGANLDFLELRPSGKMRLVQVETVLEAVRFANLSSHSGRKVILLREADRLQADAANALLKTLEEPARGLLILLVSVHPYRLLPTILSRCARFDLGGAASVPDLPAWSELSRDVGALMERALVTRGKGAALLIAEAYGLLSRLERCHALLLERALEAEPPPEGSEDDPDERARLRDAHESRLERQCRSLVLSALAERLREIARAHPGAAPALAEALAALEDAERRIQWINVPPVAALETALLDAVRALSRA